MNKIGIIGAMAIEIEILRSAMEQNGALEAVQEGGLTFYCGMLHGKNIVAVKSGVGKVNAALCAQRLALSFKVDGIINTGIAGAAAQGLGVFDMVVSSDALYHDMDAVVFGYKPCQIPQMDVFAFQADAALIAAAKAAFAESKYAATHRLVCGRVASGDQFISEKERKAHIIALCNPACIEMEGAAIAHSCFLNQIPYVILRCMSDTADDEAAYSFNEKTAADESAEIVERMIVHLA